MLHCTPVENHLVIIYFCQNVHLLSFEDFPSIWKALLDPDVDGILPEVLVCPRETRLTNLQEGFHCPPSFPDQSI
jgi:hypothetical protein